MEETGVKVFVALAGLFCIGASILNWDWFFNNRKARPVVSIFGRTGARVIYTILGLVLIVGGLLLI